MPRPGANNTYFGNIREALSSLLTGLTLSARHLWQARRSRKPIGVADDHYFTLDTGIVTLQYPHEAIPVPDHGRYQLHNEIEDCIVCDKCAKICPVNCITIEPIRATEEIGKTSDGSSKRLYAATFDIDMGKCCFCGLCTTVCPTECLTMTHEYDFSEYDVADHNFAFATMSAEEAVEKRNEWDVFQQAKQKAAAAKKAAAPTSLKVTPKAGAKPAYRPKATSMKPKISPTPKPGDDSPGNGSPGND